VEAEADGRGARVETRTAEITRVERQARIFRDLGMPRLQRTRKRVPRQMKLFEKAEPGESVQVDVKFVKIAGRWAFQYTALDDCTRRRLLS